MGLPIYIHPNTPSNAMIKPFMERGLDGAVFGFAVETSLHALRIVVSGAFDRFPNLRIVLGHLGEGLPYWLSRIDFMHGARVRSNRYASQPRIERKASAYLKENFYYTTSGMAWTPSIRYVQSVMGMDRLMYAIDYPYQFIPEEVNVTDNAQHPHGRDSIAVGCSPFSNVKTQAIAGRRCVSSVRRRGGVNAT